MGYLLRYWVTFPDHDVVTMDTSFNYNHCNDKMLVKTLLKSFILYIMRTITTDTDNAVTICTLLLICIGLLS